MYFLSTIERVVLLFSKSTIFELLTTYIASVISIYVWKIIVRKEIEITSTNLAAYYYGNPFF